MSKIKTLWFSKLPNAAHFTFFLRFKDAISGAGAAVQQALTGLFDPFNNLFALEQQNIDWVRKSEFTAKIADADHRIDAAIRGLKAQVNAARHSLNPLIAAAGEQLAMMLKNYGNIIDKPYEAEIGDVKGILDNLSGHYAPDVMVAGCLEWQTELEAAFVAFFLLYGERNAQSVTKPPKNFGEVRHEIEGVYHQMVNIVNAGAVMNASPDFAALINVVNPEIERLNNEFHHAKRDVAACQPAPIPQQPYTGKPVTPTPEVLFVTPQGTIALELGKDYNLAFRNNTEAGNASCIIHGKGGYKGSKMVTFIIAR